MKPFSYLLAFLIAGFSLAGCGSKPVEIASIETIARDGSTINRHLILGPSKEDRKAVIQEVVMLAIDARRNNRSPEFVYDIQMTDSLKSDCKGPQFEFEYRATTNIRHYVEFLDDGLRLMESFDSENTWSERGWFAGEPELCKAVSELFESRLEEMRLALGQSPKMRIASFVGQGASNERNHRLCN